MEKENLTVSEIVNSAKIIIKDMSKRTILNACKNMDSPFEIIYDIIKSYDILNATDKDKEHIAWFIVGYCDLD